MDWKNLFDESHQEDSQEHSLKANLKRLDFAERYEAKALHNEGAMKKIYKCKDLSTGREVAYACPKKSDFSHSESFLREANIAASLQHPNIIPVYDIGLCDDEAYFTMKMIDGKSLDQIIFKDKEPLSLNSLIAIFVKVCEAISFAHSRGIIHLDLKPENIQISEYGEVLVCDWGLAKVVDWSQAKEENYLNNEAFYQADDLQNTLFGYIKGTPGYLSPEQAKGSSSKKSYSSDIYSLGAILYSILTRKVPIEGKSLEEILKKTTEGQIIPPRQLDKSIPRSLEAICLKALQTEPSARYSSVTEIVEDIELYNAGFAPKAQKVNLAQQALLLIRRKPLLFATAFSSIALIALITSSASYQLQSKNKTLAEQKDQIEEQKDEINKHLKNVEKANSDLRAVADFASVEAYKEALNHWRYFRVADTLKFFRIANRLAPNNPDFIDLRLAFAIAEMDQEKVHRFYQELSPEDQKKYQIFKDFSLSVESSPEEFIKTLKAIHDEKFWAIAVALHYNYNLKTAHSSAKMDIIPEAIHMHYDYAQVENFKWTYKNGKYKIDLSHNGRFRALHTLSGLNVTELNVSHSEEAQFEHLYCPNLQVIDISHSKLENTFASYLSIGHYTRLHTLILDHTKSRDHTFSALADTAIQKLSMRYVKLDNYDFVKKMKNLETFILDKVPTNFPKDYKHILKIKP